MKPEHEALVKRLNDVALAHAHYGTDDAPMSAEAADAIVSLSAELARYREAPTVEKQFRSLANGIGIWMPCSFFSATNPDTCEYRELIVRPTEAK